MPTLGALLYAAYISLLPSLTFFGTLNRSLKKKSSVQTVVTRIQTEANREGFIEMICAYLLLIPRFLEKMMLHRCSFRPFGLGN